MVFFQNRVGNEGRGGKSLESHSGLNQNIAAPLPFRMEKRNEKYFVSHPTLFSPQNRNGKKLQFSLFWGRKTCFLTLIYLRSREDGTICPENKLIATFFCGEMGVVPRKKLVESFRNGRRRRGMRSPSRLFAPTCFFPLSEEEEEDTVSGGRAK